MRRATILSLVGAGLMISASVFASGFGDPIALKMDDHLAAKQIAEGGLIAQTADDGVVQINGKQATLPSGTTAISKNGPGGTLCVTALISPARQDILGIADHDGCLGTIAVVPGQSWLLVARDLQPHGDAKAALTLLMVSSFVESAVQVLSTQTTIPR